MSTSTQPTAAVLTRALVSLAVMLVVMAVVLFVPAGTINWQRGWWYEAVFLVCILISIVVLWRVNPEIFAARSRAVRSDTKAWDKVIVAIVITGFVAVLPVSALNLRLGWSQLPDWLVVVGYVVFLVGYAIQTWSQAVNRHFEPSVRIQEDRGHTVIDSGPYASVRHPGYISGSMLVVGTALALGSGLALIPAAIVVVTLVVRTLLEEQTLVAELPGYAAYRQRVKSRWIPGVW